MLLHLPIGATKPPIIFQESYVVRNARRAGRLDEMCVEGTEMFISFCKWPKNPA